MLLHQAHQCAKQDEKGQAEQWPSRHPLLAAKDTENEKSNVAGHPGERGVDSDGASNWSHGVFKYMYRVPNTSGCI